MAELDLIPASLRARRQLGRWLKRLAVAQIAVVLLLAGARVGLALGIRERELSADNVHDARLAQKESEARREELEREQRDLTRRLQMLSGLRGGLGSRELFRTIDEAMVPDLWFVDWRFRRAGEIVPQESEAVRTGYFLVIPIEGEGASENQQAWLMRTHMEIAGKAIDHSTLARFVERLVSQPTVVEARIVSTHMRPEGSREVVDFKLALVVRENR